MTLTTFLTDLNEIIISLTTMLSDIMSVFMEPPLIVYTGLTIFTIAWIIIVKILASKYSLFLSKRYYEKDYQSRLSKSQKTVEDFYKK